MRQLERPPSRRWFAAVGRGRLDHQTGRVATGRDVGLHVDVVGRRQRERRVGAPLDVVADVDAAGAGGIAACRAGQRDIGAGQTGAQLRTGQVAAAGCHGVVVRVDQPGTSAALRGQRRHGGVRGDAHMVGAGLHEAAVAALRRAGVERARHLQCPTFAEQVDPPFPLCHGLRPHLAGVVDHRVQQALGRLGGQHHQPAIGPDRSAVLHQRIQGGLVQRNPDQRIAVEVQAHLAACRQGHAAQAGLDEAIVAYLRAHQHDVAAVSRVELPPVDHCSARIAAASAELRAPGHEVRVTQAQR